jgi:hypothetical protein
LPSYVDSPFQVPILAQKGVATYLFGSYNYRQAHTKAWLTNVALTTNVATVTVQIVEGEIPLVGSLISISNSSSTSGTFNVKRAVVTGATIAGDGTGTITFALTHADIASAADTGTVIVEVPEIGETIAAGASIPCLIQAPEGDSQFTVETAVTCSTMPTGLTVVLQKAIHDRDAEYTTVGNAAVIAASAFTTGPVAHFTLERGHFYRFLASGLSGSGKIVAKIGG